MPDDREQREIEAVARDLKQAVRGAPVTDEEWNELPPNRRAMWSNEAQAAIAALDRIRAEKKDG